MMRCQYKKKNSYSYEISSSMDGALLEMMCGICQRQRSAGCAFLPIETPLENEEYFGGMCKKRDHDRCAMVPFKMGEIFRPLYDSLFYLGKERGRMPCEPMHCLKFADACPDG